MSDLIGWLGRFAIKTGKALCDFMLIKQIPVVTHTQAVPVVQGILASVYERTQSIDQLDTDKTTQTQTDKCSEFIHQG